MAKLRPNVVKMQMQFAQCKFATNASLPNVNLPNNLRYCAQCAMLQLN